MSDWQTLATLLVLAAAGVFLAWRVVRFVRGSQKGGCGSCASKTALPGKPLVPLDLPNQRR
jgi:hypothetical protein